MSPSLRFYALFPCIFCAGFVLSSCTSLDMEFEEENPSEVIDITVENEGAPPPPVLDVETGNTFTARPENNSDISREPITSYEPIEASDVIESSGLVELVSTVSSGSVDIYPLDGALQTPEKYQARSGGIRDIVPPGQVYSTSPSVQVFPLDEGMRSYLPERYMPSGQDDALLPMPGEVRVTESDQGEFVTVSAPGRLPMRVYFAHDSALPDHQALEAVVAAVKNSGSAALSVEGHASKRAGVQDPAQRKIVNLRVSLDRAFAMSKKLIEMGIPAESIRTVGWGEAKPSNPADGKNAEAASRRVEILPR